MLIIAEPTKFCAIEISEINRETTAPEVCDRKTNARGAACAYTRRSADRRSADGPPCSPSSCGSRSQSPARRTAPHIAAVSASSLPAGVGAQIERRGHRDAPSVDHSVDSFEMRLRDQQHVEHVFEGERKRERQRELQDAHDGAARHQPQMRPNVAEKPHQGSARNETVEDSREETAATLVGFVGSASRLPGETIHRLRRTGDYSRTTIWHAAEFSSRAGARKYVNFLEEKQNLESRRAL